MKTLTSDQENEQLQEGGPPLWFCRSFCNACNGDPERWFWCGSQFHNELCDWTEEQQDREMEKKKEKELGKKKSDEEVKEEADQKRPRKKQTPNQGRLL